MNFIYEFKNRIILIINLQLILFCVCYHYKETLCFLIVNNIILINKNFYFLSTTLVELFNTYLNIINFFILQFLIVYGYYYLFVFFIAGLFKKEIIFLKKLLFNLIFTIILTTIVTFLITMPFVFFLFSTLNKMAVLKNNLLHFEVKILNYFQLFKNMYYANFFCLFSMKIFVFIEINFLFSLTYLTKCKKIYYFCFFLVSNILAFDLITNVLVFFFVLLAFELFLLMFLIKKNLKKRKKQDLNLRPQKWK